MNARLQSLLGRIEQALDVTGDAQLDKEDWVTLKAAIISSGDQAVAEEVKKHGGLTVVLVCSAVSALLSAGVMYWVLQ